VVWPATVAAMSPRTSAFTHLQRKSFSAQEISPPAPREEIGEPRKASSEWAGDHLDCKPRDILGQAFTMKTVASNSCGNPNASVEIARRNARHQNHNSLKADLPQLLLVWRSRKGRSRITVLTRSLETGVVAPLETVKINTTGLGEVA